jgi:hypothetical protein
MAEATARAAISAASQVSSLFWALATPLLANAATSAARQKLAVLKMGPGMTEDIVRRRKARGYFGNTVTAAGFEE